MNRSEFLDKMANDESIIKVSVKTVGDGDVEARHLSITPYRDYTVNLYVDGKVIKLDSGDYDIYNTFPNSEFLIVPNELNPKLRDFLKKMENEDKIDSSSTNKSKIKEVKK